MRRMSSPKPVFSSRWSPKTPNLDFTLAPLIIQEVGPGDKGQPTGGGRPEQDQFGSLTLSNGSLSVAPSRPTVYVWPETMLWKGTNHAQLTYLWSYGAESRKPAKCWFPLQGIRITLNSAGQPVIWEVLADNSGIQLIFVAQSLEAAALAQFGKPLPGRRYSVERSLIEAPNTVVARVVDDGPVPMGPIIYLSAGTRTVSTLICRCMPAQVKKLSGTTIYTLLPGQSDSADALLPRARLRSDCRTAFWPGDGQSEKRLQKCLRLPGSF